MVKARGRLRATRRKAGLCFDCGKQPRPKRIRCESCADDLNRRIRKNYQRHKLKAFEKIASNYGDGVPRCRIDITPNTLVSDLPCRGKLTIDHMNGGGRRERQGKGMYRDTVIFYRAINSGKRAVEDLRLLCQLHQLWNQLD